MFAASLPALMARGRNRTVPGFHESRQARAATSGDV
jgi:hypothetical protein